MLDVQTGWLQRPFTVTPITASERSHDCDPSKARVRLLRAEPIPRIGEITRVRRAHCIGLAALKTGITYEARLTLVTTVASRTLATTAGVTGIDGGDENR